jgi:hypothetical protein
MRYRCEDSEKERHSLFNAQMPAIAVNIDRVTFDVFEYEVGVGGVEKACINQSRNVRVIETPE